MVHRDSSLCSWVCRDKPQLKSNVLQASYLKSEGLQGGIRTYTQHKGIASFLTPVPEN